MINNLGGDVHTIHYCLFVRCLLILNGFPFLLRQRIVNLLSFLVQHLVFGNDNVSSADDYLKLISSCGSVVSLGISSLNKEHGLRINMVVFK
jgi:hypothetical protein